MLATLLLNCQTGGKKKKGLIYRQHLSQKNTYGVKKGKGYPKGIVMRRESL